MTPIAVLIRFRGDPDELAERFEKARQMWIEAQDGDYERPAFFATCRRKDGILVLTGWESAVGHRAFGEGIGPHIHAVELPAPEEIEHMRIETLGWEWQRN
jgi:hypothetical protein